MGITSKLADPVSLIQPETRLAEPVPVPVAGSSASAMPIGQAALVGMAQDTLLKIVYGLLGAIANKLGLHGAADVVAGFPALYNAARGQHASWAEKFGQLSRELDQLKEQQGEPGHMLHLAKVLVQVAAQLTELGGHARQKSLTLAGAQHSVTALGELLNDEVLLQQLPAHVAPGLAQALDVVHSLLDDALVASSDDGHGFSQRMLLRASANDKVLALLPYRVQWAVRLVSGLADVALRYNTLTQDSDLSAAAKGQLLLNLLADSPLKGRLQSPSTPGDGDREQGWLVTLGDAAQTLGRFKDYPLRQDPMAQCVWAREWLRSPASQRLAVMLFGEAWVAPLKGVLEPSEGMSAQRSMIQAVLPAEISWLVTVFGQLGSLVEQAGQLQLGDSPWGNALQLVGLLLDSDLGVLERLPDWLQRPLQVAHSRIKKGQTPSWSEVVKQVAAPAFTQLIPQIAMNEGAQQPALIHHLANAAALMNRFMAYPQGADWSAQLGWGVELLASGARPVLELILEPALAQSLLKPFEIMQGMTFPVGASTDEQALALSMLAKQSGLELGAFGTSLLQNTLATASALMEPGGLWRQTASAAQGLASGSSALAVAGRTLLSSQLPTLGVETVALGGKLMRAGQQAYAAAPPGLSAGDSLHYIQQALAQRANALLNDPSPLVVTFNPTTLMLVSLTRMLAKVSRGEQPLRSLADLEQLVWDEVSGRFSGLGQTAGFLRAHAKSVAALAWSWYRGEQPVQATEAYLLKAKDDITRSNDLSEHTRFVLDLLPVLPVFMGAAQDNWTLAKDTQASLRLFQAVGVLAQSESPALKQLAGQLQAAVINAVVDMVLLPVGGRTAVAWGPMGVEGSPMGAGTQSSAPLYNRVIAPWQPDDLQSKSLSLAAAAGGGAAVLAALMLAGAGVREIYQSRRPRPTSESVEMTTFLSAAQLDEHSQRSGLEDVPMSDDELNADQAVSPPVPRLGAGVLKVVTGASMAAGMLYALKKMHDNWSDQAVVRRLVEPITAHPETSLFEELYGTLMDRYGDALFEDPALMTRALDEVLGDPAVAAFGDEGRTESTYEVLAPLLSHHQLEHAEPPQSYELLGAAAVHGAAARMADQTPQAQAPDVQNIDLTGEIRRALRKLANKRRLESLRPTWHPHRYAEDWIEQERGQYFPHDPGLLNGDTSIRVDYTWQVDAGETVVSQRYPLRAVVSPDFKSVKPPPQSPEHDAQLEKTVVVLPKAFPQALKASIRKGMPQNFSPVVLPVSEGWQSHPYADAWIAEQVQQLAPGLEITGDSLVKVTLVESTGARALQTSAFVTLREVVSPGYVQAHNTRALAVAPLVFWRNGYYPVALTDVFDVGMPYEYRPASGAQAWSISRQLLSERLVRELGVPLSATYLVDPQKDWVKVSYTSGDGAAAKPDDAWNLLTYLDRRRTLFDDPRYLATPTFLTDHPSLTPARYSPLLALRLQEADPPQYAHSRLIDVFISEINALYRGALRGQQLTLTPDLPMRVRYREQLKPEAQARTVEVSLALRSVVDPAFKRLFSSAGYPRRSDLEVGFSSGFASTRLGEIRDVLLAGLPEGYRPWGAMTKKMLLEDITRRSAMSRAIAPADRLTISVMQPPYPLDRFTGATVVWSQSRSLRDHLLASLPAVDSSLLQYLKIDWPSHYTEQARKRLSSPIVREAYQRSEKQAGDAWVASARTFRSAEPASESIAQPLAGSYQRGVFVPTDYKTRKQYDQLHKQTLLQWKAIDDPVLDPRNYVINQYQKAIDAYYRERPKAQKLQASSPVEVTERETSAATGRNSGGAITRTRRTFQLWQLLASQHEREVALSDSNGSLEFQDIPKEVLTLSEWIKARPSYNVEAQAKRRLADYSSDADVAGVRDELYGGLIRVKLLAQQQANAENGKVVAAIGKLLEGGQTVRQVSFRGNPLAGVFMLPIDGLPHGLMFSVTDEAVHWVPKESSYVVSAGRNVPFLESADRIRPWLKDKLALYAQPENLRDDARFEYDYDDRQSGLQIYTSPYSFRGNYTLGELPGVMRRSLLARVESDIDVLVYTERERRIRASLNVVRGVSQVLAAASIFVAPGVGAVVGLLAGAADTAAAFAQVGQALSAEEERSAQRGAVMAAALNGLFGIAAAAQAGGSAARAGKALATKWISGYQRMRTNFTALARRPNPAWRVQQSLSGLQPGTSGLLQGVFSVGERRFIQDGEAVFEIRENSGDWQLKDGETDSWRGKVVRYVPQSESWELSDLFFSATRQLAKAKPGALTRVESAIKALERGSENSKRLASYMMGLEESPGSEAVIASWRGVLTRVRQNIRAIDFSKNVEVVEAISEDSTAVGITRPHVYEAYRRGETSAKYMAFSARELHQRKLTFGANKAGYSRYVDHAVTHESFHLPNLEIAQVTDVGGYAKILEGGSHDLTDLLWYAYSTRTGQVNADSWAVFVDLLSQVDEPGASIDALLDRIMQWRQDMEKFLPTRSNLDAVKRELLEQAEPPAPARLNEAAREELDRRAQIQLDKPGSRVTYQRGGSGTRGGGAAVGNRETATPITSPLHQTLTTPLVTLEYDQYEKFNIWFPVNRASTASKYLVTAHGTSDFFRTAAVSQDTTIYFYTKYGVDLEDLGLSSDRWQPVVRVRAGKTEVPSGNNVWRDASKKEMKELTGSDQPGRFKDMSLTHYERDGLQGTLETWSLQPNIERPAIVALKEGAHSSVTEMQRVLPAASSHAPVDIHVLACRGTFISQALDAIRDAIRQAIG